jgi:hypothetical protein
MNNKIFHVAFIAFFYLLNQTFCLLNVVPNSLKGTETLNLRVTDKQLAIQKYLASLTIFQSKSEHNQTMFGWKGWEANYNNDQKDMYSVRYPLAFIGYSIAAMAYKTPIYRELSANILDNVIQRLLEKHQYEYIQDYWSHLSTFPDPVANENIMYSGHLAMLISLYESISGNLKYSTQGWQFKWSNQSSIGYDSKKLMDAIFKQSLQEESGGICCEPNSIFITCNNHPRLAFVLFDQIHNTSYASINKKWEEWVRKHGRATIDDFRYFKIIYYKPIHTFIPFYGSTGNDAWTLTFMNWYSDKEFLVKGYEKLTKNIR